MGKEPKLMLSGSWKLNKSDWIGWGNRTLQTLAPYLVVLIPVVIEKLPRDWAYATITVWVLQRIYDLLRRWYTNNK